MIPLKIRRGHVNYAKGHPRNYEESLQFCRASLLKWEMDPLKIERHPSQYRKGVPHKTGRVSPINCKASSSKLESCPLKICRGGVSHDWKVPPQNFKMVLLEICRTSSSKWIKVSLNFKLSPFNIEKGRL